MMGIWQNSGVHQRTRPTADLSRTATACPSHAESPARLQHKAEEVALLHAHVTVACRVELGLPLGLRLRGLARRARLRRSSRRSPGSSSRVPHQPYRIVGAVMTSLRVSAKLTPRAGSDESGVIATSPR